MIKTIIIEPTQFYLLCGFMALSHIMIYFIAYYKGIYDVFKTIKEKYKNE